MKFMISHFNLYKDDSKQVILKKCFFRIIKSCLYLILIDRFLISININCADSSVFFSIETEDKKMMLKDRVKESNKEIYKSVLESQGQKGSKKIGKKSKSNDKEKVTTGTDESSSTSALFKFKLFTLECNIQSMLNYTLPDVIKDFDEDKDIQNKIFDLIKEIKSKVKSYDENLIEKIEKKMIRKQNGNSKFDEIIENFTNESKKLLFGFEIAKKLFYKAKTSQSSTLVPDFDDYLEFKFSEFNSNREQLYKGLIFSKFTFFKEKNKTSLILMVLNKILELTPAEFKRDKEVLKAILSLD